MTVAQPIVLASASPQRSMLLELVAIPFVVYPVSVDETFPENAGPTETAVSVAETKARAALEEWRGGRRPDGLQAGSGPPSVLVAADTVVWGPEGPMGKPADEEEARAMIRLLAGKAHHVITGVTVAFDGVMVSEAEDTEVEIAAMSDAEIGTYVGRGEWQGAAGAYRIQGFGSRHVPAIHGCFYNVVGLPIHRLCAILGRNGRRY